MDKNLHQQIEAAFDYRGHVTLNFKNGDKIEGFVYNRVLKGTAPFVEIFLKGSAEPRSYQVSALTGIALTGVDEAAGKSYQDWLEKKRSMGQ